MDNDKINSLSIRDVVQLLEECGHTRAEALARAQGRALVKIKARAKLIHRLTGLSLRSGPTAVLRRIYRAIWGREAASGLGPSDRGWFALPQARLLAVAFLAAYEQAVGNEVERLVNAYTACDGKEAGWTPERAWDLLLKVEHRELGYGPCVRCGEVALSEHFHIICPECDGSLKASHRLRSAFAYRREGGPLKLIHAPCPARSVYRP